MAWRKAAAAHIADTLDKVIEEDRQRKVALEHIPAEALRDTVLVACLGIAAVRASLRRVLDHKLAAEPLVVMELVVALHKEH